MPMSVFGRLLSLLLALVPLSAWAAVNHPPVVGQDYVEISDGQPFAPLAGKIEVVEIFGYTCVHCAHFESSCKYGTRVRLRMCVLPWYLRCSVEFGIRSRVRI